MITLIHGDNIVQSRNYYLDIKNQYKNIKVLSGDKLSMTDFVETIEGDGLFSTTEAVFIEQIFSKKRAGEELDAIIGYLNHDHEVPLILWEGKAIDKKQIVKLKKVTTKLFSYPKILFQLLDAIQPNNGKQLVNLFHQATQTEAAELILFMITKQVRILLALQEQTLDSIDEVKRIQPWQKGKLQRQAKLFSTEQLIHLHTKLYNFDLGYKTGGLAAPLEASLDFFFAEI